MGLENYCCWRKNAIKRACVFAKRMHACLSVTAYAPYVCLEVFFFFLSHTLKCHCFVFGVIIRLLSRNRRVIVGVFCAASSVFTLSY